MTIASAPASRTMEGFLARWYAKTRANDMSDFVNEAQDFSQTLAPNAEVLEIAPGPGFFSIELAKLGNFKITALDLSKTLLDISRQNAQDAGVHIDFRLGDVHGMPFPPKLFRRRLLLRRLQEFLRSPPGPARNPPRPPPPPSSTSAKTSPWTKSKPMSTKAAAPNSTPS
jgi:ubiquinone/menaquinone biosynthesis C-methylase UbiE